MDSKAYFEKVMQDFNQFRNGRSLRKYCTDEGIDYHWLIKYKKEYPGKRTEEQERASALEFVPISVQDEPQEKGWQVHQLILQSPSGDVLEIKSTSLSGAPFYSKDYRKVRILHYDVNGYVLYSKWFDEGKFLKPEFEECKKSHEISREVLTLLLSTAVQTTIII